jgi:hypothetical protein
MCDITPQNSPNATIHHSAPSRSFHQFNITCRLLENSASICSCFFMSSCTSLDNCIRSPIDDGANNKSQKMSAPHELLSRPLNLLVSWSSSVYRLVWTQVHYTSSLFNFILILTLSLTLIFMFMFLPPEEMLMFPAAMPARTASLSSGVAVLGTAAGIQEKSRVRFIDERGMIINI